jgi:threonine aldolase
LSEDHRKARELGAQLEQLSFVKKVEPVETNIIIFEISENKLSSDAFLELLAKKGIQMIGMGQGKLRMVTHMDYTDEMHAHTLKQLVSLDGV